MKFSLGKIKKRTKNNQDIFIKKKLGMIYGIFSYIQN